MRLAVEGLTMSLIAIRAIELLVGPALGVVGKFNPRLGTWVDQLRTARAAADKDNHARRFHGGIFHL